MVDGKLKRMWRRDAYTASGVDGLEAQIAWLEGKRTAYADAIKAGDWEVGSSSYDGASTTSKRLVSDKANHDAILAVIEDLEAELGTGLGSTSKGKMLSFRIQTGN